MSIRDALLPEFEQEVANTRKTLERIPEDKLAWKPHEKSLSLGDLATHLSNLPSWTAISINDDRFDVNPPGEEAPKREAVKSVKEALALFDKHVTDARAAIMAASDRQFMEPWTLLSGGKSLFSMPKIAVVRSFMMNHMIHHRGQLTVYLRLNDVPVPAIYGNSADES